LDDRWFFKLFEFGFVSVVIGGILIWQLWDVNKSIRDDKKRAAEQQRKAGEDRPH
jgi:hypothetical protein